jgi:cytochrome c oxidase subunit 2
MPNANRRRMLLAAAGLAVCGAGAARQVTEQVVKITVKRFEYAPREISLRSGVPAVLEITSLDVPHGFNLPDFHVRADVMPGRVTKVRFTPDRKGTFTFRCDVFCGTGHEELDGMLTVI